jgi:hypothetical protein
MDQMSADEWRELSEAVVTWTGWGAPTSMVPQREDELLVQRFGPREAMRLIPKVRAMHHEFYLSKAHQVAKDMPEMAAMASGEFKRNNPGVPEDAVRALAWCYTYDYK